MESKGLLVSKPKVFVFFGSGLAVSFLLDSAEGFTVFGGAIVAFLIAS